MTTGAAKKAIAMIEFFQAVLDPDNRFLAYALAMGGLASIAFGIIGTFVTIKRISYLAGAISHSVFGGIGLALYLQVGQGIAWFDPILGAVLAAVIAALVVGLVSIHAKEREDTIIGTLWAVGMACGILFIDRTPGYFSLSSYLFGDILLISQKDLLFVIGLDLVIAGVVGLFSISFRVCFDAEFTLLRGINTTFFYLFLLVLTALTVVLLVRIVGIVLVIALLTIPPAIAGFYARRLWQMMLLSVLLCTVFTWTGLGISYQLSLSSGPTIIVLCGITYLVLLALNRLVFNLRR